MILDSSALVSVFLGEPAAEELSAKMKASPVLGIGTPTLAETLLILARRPSGDPTRLLFDLLRDPDATMRNTVVWRSRLSSVLGRDAIQPR
jgi:uncharacterized protein with PIN domain